MQKDEEGGTHLVVEVPRVVEVVDLAVLAVPAARLARVGEVTAERLGERDLAQRLGALQGERERESGTGRSLEGKEGREGRTFSSMSWSGSSVANMASTLWSP